MLNLGYRLIALEAAADGVDRLVVVGVEAVEHGLGQVARGFQRAQERRGLGGGSVVVDAVKAGIRPHAVVHGVVVVAAAAVVQLHGPVALLVLMRHKEHEGGLEHGLLTFAHGFAGKAAAEDGLHLILGRRGVHHVIERVVAQAAAVLGKVIHPLAQRFLEAGEAVDGHARRRGELGQVVGVVRLFQVHGLVGPPGGQNGGVEGIVLGQLLMPFQGVDGIVRGADDLHIAHGDQAAHAVTGALQLLVAQVPYLVGGAGAQGALIAEEAAQLQMAPVVQRVADALADDLGPFDELFVVAGFLAGDVLFRHAGTAHQTPLVVVAAQPHLGDVFIAQVLVDFARADVAMVVDDGAFGRHVVVERAGRGGGEQEVLVHECLHVKRSFMINMRGKAEEGYSVLPRRISSPVKTVFWGMSRPFKTPSMVSTQWSQMARSLLSTLVISGSQHRQ